MAQFNHRNLGYLTYSIAAYLFYQIAFKLKVGNSTRRAAFLVFFMANYQVFSGINTLLNLAPPDKCSAHQMTAFLTYSSILFLCHTCRKPLII